MGRKRLFLSYNFEDREFVGDVSEALREGNVVDCFFYSRRRTTDQWPALIEKELTKCDVFVFFVGATLGETQLGEALKTASAERLVVLMPTVEDPASDRPTNAVLPIDLQAFYRLDPIRVRDPKDRTECASKILRLLKVPGVLYGIPPGYPFQYEKDIIREFLEGAGKLSDARVKEGCPRTWPRVPQRRHTNRDAHQNPISDEWLGGFRDWDSEKEEEKNPEVTVAALSDYLTRPNSDGTGRLTLSEAGPRKFHYYPSKPNRSLTVALLVSGGIAPGINAVISGIVSRHIEYYDGIKGAPTLLNVYCCREGFDSLLPHRSNGFQIYTLSPDQRHDQRPALQELANYAHRGGSVIPTARSGNLMTPEDQTKQVRSFKDIVQNLKGKNVEILYVIGGDGSMRAAHGIQLCADEEEDYELSVVGVPKTMDNDVLWVWQSFGFPSAVEWAKEAVRHLYTEVTSNPRVCVMQLFGSDSGFVVCHAALASGVCDLVLTPEVPFDVESIVKYMAQKLQPRFVQALNGTSPYGIVLMAETAIPQRVKESMSERGPGCALDDPDFKLSGDEVKAVLRFVKDGRRVKGQTPDELRSAGLKIVAGAVRKAIRELAKQDRYWNDFRVFTNEPRHLIRAIPPSSSDILFARRLGMLAVDCAMAGYHDFMISQWLTEYVMVPLQLVVLGRKRVPKTGIFWKSVLASTGQPPRMAEDPAGSAVAEDQTESESVAVD